jgi:hypothetical protein
MNLVLQVSLGLGSLLAMTVLLGIVAGVSTPNLHTSKFILN